MDTFCKNVTTEQITLCDLNNTILPPGQIVNLLLFAKKKDIEASSDLSLCLSKGYVQLGQWRPNIFVITEYHKSPNKTDLDNINKITTTYLSGFPTTCSKEFPIYTTAPLILSNDPTLDLESATKHYVDIQDNATYEKMLKVFDGDIVIGGDLDVLGTITTNDLITNTIGSSSGSDDCYITLNCDLNFNGKSIINAANAGGGPYLKNIVEDLNPKLGATLDLNGFSQYNTSQGSYRGIKAFDFQQEINNPYQVASGNYSFIAGGIRNTASGVYSHSEGAYNTSSGPSSHSEGYLTQATESQAHSEGIQTIASGIASHAEGNNTEASGDASHAEGQNTEANTYYAHAEGAGTLASGIKSHAEGDNTTASGTASHAEGYYTTASGNYSHAEGSGTTASGERSHAEGTSTTASTHNAHAEGKGTIASEYASHAEGYSTVASGIDSHAEGSNTQAVGVHSHAEGNYTTASGGRSHAEGYRTTASNYCSHAEGKSTNASGYCSHAEGELTTASHQDSHAEGILTLAAGSYSGSAYFFNCTISGASPSWTVTMQGDTSPYFKSFSLAGFDSRVISRIGTVTYSTSPEPNTTFDVDVDPKNATKVIDLNKVNATHAEGRVTVANGVGSHTEGVGTLAGYAPSVIDHITGTDPITVYILGDVRIQFSGTETVLFNTEDGNFFINDLSFDGTYTTFVVTGGPVDATTVVTFQWQGVGAHAEGSFTKALGEGSHAEGKNTKASAYMAHAEGAYTIASDISAHAEGMHTTASSGCTHAEGYYTVASAMSSHAEGHYTTASGSYSHAEGYRTLASGHWSHAENEYTTASGYYSHAEGMSTVASGHGSHAEGRSTIASGVGSHAEGNRTTASGDDSHAEGSYSTASGQYSHAEGNYTTASGIKSHTEGSYTTASGNYSHSQNYYTIAQGKCQTVIGKYNIPQGSIADYVNTDHAFIIGNGTSDIDRSNALTVDWEGLLTAHSGIIENDLTVLGSIDTNLLTVDTINGVIDSAECILKLDCKTRIGNSIDNTLFDSTGHQTMSGEAKPWREELSDTLSLRQTGPGVSVDNAENSVNFLTTANYLNDYMYTNIQLNHDKDLLSDIHPHLHFWQTTAGIPNWLVEYRWQINGGTKTTAWTKLPCNGFVFPYTAGTLNQIAEFDPISVPSNTNLSDVVQFRISRDYTNASGAFTGGDPVNATVSCTNFDIHFQISSIGSSEEYSKT